jgi:sugar phosphate isomerase/epimerase
MIQLTGIADESGAGLETQIRAHKELGWSTIEMRMVEVQGVKANLHELPEALFEEVCAGLEAAEMGVCGLGSLIGNWGKKIEDDFSITLAEVGRAIPRMQRLGTRLVRVMSYAVCKAGGGGDAVEQYAEERFEDAGLVMVHENCMNWGGMSVEHVMRLNEGVPGLKWVFDTGNPVIVEDRARPGHRQDAWEMYEAIKPHMAHVHVKDGVWNAGKGDADYSYPGEGDGAVRRILADVLQSDYKGYVSIEPHVAVVFHGAGAVDGLSAEEKAREQYDSYVKYGRRLETLVAELRAGA